MKSLDYNVYVSVGILYCALADLRITPKINGQTIRLPVPLNVFVDTHQLTPVPKVDLDNCFGLDEQYRNALERSCSQYSSVYNNIFSSVIHTMCTGILQTSSGKNGILLESVLFDAFEEITCLYKDRYYRLQYLFLQLQVILELN